MADTPTTPQQRLRQILDEAGTIEAAGIRSAEDSTKLEELLTEGHALRGQLEQNERSKDLRAWSGQSAGMLTLADGTGVGVSMTPDGGAIVEPQLTSMTRAQADDARAQQRSERMAQEYQEGRYDPRMQKTISAPAYRSAFRDYLRSGVGSPPPDKAIRTLQEGADASGGFLVPSDILDRVIAKEPTPTRVAGRVTQLTSSRDNLIIPKVNYFSDDLYTTGMRITWTGEVPSSSTAMRVTDPVFGQTHIPIYTAMMSVPVTNDMIEDASFPLVSWLSSKFAETRDLLYDNMILNGTGQGQPSGILLNPAADNSQPGVVNSGDANTLTADGLISLGYALPEQYEDGACFVMNKTSTLKTVAQLKDEDLRYLYGMGMQDSGLKVDMRAGRNLLGYDVVLSQFMPNIAASAYPIIFGDLTGYYMVNRVGFSIQVLRELYAETNQVLVLGRLRFGGQITEPWKTYIHRCHS